jgi:microcystin-dependent protein
MRAMKKTLLAGVLLLTLGPVGPAQAGTQPFIGDTMIVAFSFCPKSWAPMNGQALPISQNQALFSLLGTRYGGNGVTTFALPSARPIFTATGKTLTQCIALQGAFPSQN